MEDIYFVADLAKNTGLCRETIRNYTREGILPDKRNHRGWRIFTEADVNRVIKLRRGEKIINENTYRSHHRAEKQKE